MVAREIRNELIPHWGARPITEITRRDVVDLIEKIVDRPTPAHARNILQHIKSYLFGPSRATFMACSRRLAIG